MPISSSYAPITFAGDGVANAFAVVFPFQLQTDLVVTSTVVATGVATVLVLGTDYIVTPTSNSPANTGTVTTTVPVPTGTDLTIARSTPITQLTTWVPNDPNLSTSTMNAVDKLTMEVQELSQGGGVLPDSALAPGTSSTDTFLRGGSPRAWSNALIDPANAISLPADASTLLQVGGSSTAAIKVTSGATSPSSYRFGVNGATNPWNTELVYDPVATAWGWRTFGGSFLGSFYDSGAVNFTGTVNATLFTGAADASLITTGILDVARTGTGSGSANTFLNGTGVFAIPASGGGGVNTTTTGTFVIAAVASTQTVPVTDATGINVGNYLLISDGTHTIVGQVTVIASLNLTVDTVSIISGTAGNTMASGAAVQLGTVPGTNTIQIQDGAGGPISMGVMFLNGNFSSPGPNPTFLRLYKVSLGGGTVGVDGYISQGAGKSQLIGHDSTTSAGVIAAQKNDFWTDYLSPTAQGQVLNCNSFGGGLAQTITWGLLGPSNITPASLTPALLNVTNSLTDTQVFSYDSASGHFKMVPNGGSIPGGGNAGLFFRGDNTFSNILDLSHDSGAESIGLTLSQGVTNGSFGSTFGTASDGTYSFWIMQKRAAGTWGTPASVYCNYQVGTGIDGGVLSVGAAWTNPDGTNIERIFADKMIRTSQGLRSVYGPLSLIYEISAPASPLTIDLVNGAYQRISSLGLALTLTLADTTPLPTSLRYESELTLELNLSSHDITWPGTITWANGVTAPTIANGALNATGINIVRLIRRQGQTQWVGILENPLVAGSGTVTSVATGAGLTGGPITTTGTISIPNLGITTAMIANNAVGNAQLGTGIQPSKLLGAGASTTTFLRNDGSWAVPPGTGGGGSFSPGTSYFWTAAQTYTSSAGITSSATNSFTGLTTFTHPAWTDLNSPYATTLVQPYYEDGTTGSRNLINVQLIDSSAGSQGYKPISSYVAALNPTRTASPNGVDFYLDVRGTCPANEFAISTTSVVQSANVAANDVRDSVWLNAWGPCIAFQSTAANYTNANLPTTHSYTAGGVVRIGECNYGNAWADLGFVDDRGLSGYFAGLEFFPAWLAGTCADFYGGSPPPQRSFNVQWAIAIGGAAPGSVGPSPKNWTGILFDKEAIVAGGIGINMHGSPVSTTTTGTFAIAAVGASQTVPVASTFGMNFSQPSGLTTLQISDGTHTILGYVTNISSLNLTFVTDEILAGTAGNTMASSAVATSGPGVGLNFQNSMGTGINFAGSAGGAPVGTGGGTAASFTSTGNAAITLAVDQSIKFGPIWVRGHGSGSGLQYSSNGTSWTDFTLP